MNWRLYAKCLGSPEVMYPEAAGKPVDYEPARALCRTCPVRMPCLRYALAHDEYGCWGGTDRKERLAIQAAMRRAA